MMDRCVWKHPGSPYLPLLAEAQCEPGDLSALVTNNGLESALEKLRAEGVYFTFEEFKGRQAVERGNVGFEPDPGDFDNPHVRRLMTTATTGSTGRRTQVWTNLDDRHNELLSALANGAHNLDPWTVPSATWSRSTWRSLLRGIRRADPEWPPYARFVTKVERSRLEAARYTLASHAIRVAARLSGLRAPKQIWIDARDGLPLARWAEKMLKSHGRCVISANPSQAARIALAAIENEIDLTGVLMSGTEEPATPGKINLIRSSGAAWHTFYAFAEGGVIGAGCATPVDATDVHFLSDRFGLIQHPRAVPGLDLTVDSFYFTTVSDEAPKILLNVEIDDFGIVEQRSCSCLLGDVGYDRHIRQIYSFQKLTGEGVTLLGNDLIRIIEEVLPQRFGGSSLDYQIVEEEEQKGEDSFTYVSLIIDPRVPIADEEEVLRVFLKALEDTDRASVVGGHIWAQAGTLRIKRMTPLTTAGERAKLLPLFVTRRSASAK